MRKTFLCGILTAAAISFAGTASASVIYNWQQLSSSPTISSSSGQLEITDTAYQNGGFSADYPDYNSPYLNSWPQGPVIFFTFSANGTPPAEIFRDGYNGEPRFSLQFTKDGLVNGGLYANNNESDVYMTSVDGAWNIDQYNSDYDEGTGCFSAPGCFGATGEWVLDKSTVHVSEPNAPVLFGLGLLGIAVAVRKQRARS